MKRAFQIVVLAVAVLLTVQPAFADPSVGAIQAIDASSVSKAAA
jgi:hypothetical protein